MVHPFLASVNVELRFGESLFESCLDSSHFDPQSCFGLDENIWIPT